MLGGFSHSEFLNHLTSAEDKYIQFFSCLYLITCHLYFQLRNNIPAKFFNQSAIGGNG